MLFCSSEAILNCFHTMLFAVETISLPMLSTCAASFSIGGLHGSRIRRKGAAGRRSTEKSNQQRSIMELAPTWSKTASRADTNITSIRLQRSVQNSKQTSTGNSTHFQNCLHRPLVDLVVTLTQNFCCNVSHMEAVDVPIPPSYQPSSPLLLCSPCFKMSCEISSFMCALSCPTCCISASVSFSQTSSRLPVQLIHFPSSGRMRRFPVKAIFIFMRQPALAISILDRLESTQVFSAYFACGSIHHRHKHFCHNWNLEPTSDSSCK